MSSHSVGPITELLARYSPQDQAESAELERVRELVANAEDPWTRSIPLHITASALIVHPDSRRVLLRWHERQQGWLHVGGHGDPGETDPLEVALREGREETGLADLVPWPEKAIVHVAVVSVPANHREPAHEHADLRFILATADPEAARPEHSEAPIRWLDFAGAYELVVEPNIRETLRRAERLLTVT